MNGLLLVGLASAIALGIASPSLVPSARNELLAASEDRVERDELLYNLATSSAFPANVALALGESNLAAHPTFCGFEGQVNVRTMDGAVLDRTKFHDASARTCNPAKAKARCSLKSHVQLQTVCTDWRSGVVVTTVMQGFSSNGKLSFEKKDARWVDAQVVALEPGTPGFLKGLITTELAALNKKQTLRNSNPAGSVAQKKGEFVNSASCSSGFVKVDKFCLKSACVEAAM